MSSSDNMDSNLNLVETLRSCLAGEKLTPEQDKALRELLDSCETYPGELPILTELRKWTATGETNY